MAAQLTRVAHNMTRPHAISAMRNTSAAYLRRHLSQKTRAELRKQAEADAMAATYWKAAGAFIVGGSVFGTYILGSPEEDADPSNDKYKDENVVLQYIYRARDSFGQTTEKFAGFNPNTLPPRQGPENYINDFVLVLDMEKTLTYTEWAPQYGYRTLKRPGLDFFLDWAKQACGEVVIWSEKDVLDAQLLVQKIAEKNEFFMFQFSAFYGNDMRPPEGELKVKQKDLTILNRDLAKVIVVDDDPNSVLMQNENVVRITPWDGDPNDTSLVELVSFLQTLINVNKDVRGILPSYSGVDDAGKAFVSAQKAAAEAQAAKGSSPLPQQQQQSASQASSDSSWTFLGIRLW